MRQRKTAIKFVAATLAVIIVVPLVFAGVASFQDDEPEIPIHDTASCERHLAKGELIRADMPVLPQSVTASGDYSEQNTEILEQILDVTRRSILWAEESILICGEIPTLRESIATWKRLETELVDKLQTVNVPVTP